MLVSTSPMQIKCNFCGISQMWNWPLTLKWHHLLSWSPNITNLVTHGQWNSRLWDSFPSAQLYGPLASTKLYCLVTEASVRTKAVIIWSGIATTPHIWHVAPHIWHMAVRQSIKQMQRGPTATMHLLIFICSTRWCGCFVFPFFRFLGRFLSNKW